MIETTDLIIPKEVLQNVKMSAENLAIEIAVYLYEKERLTLGQAKRLAGLDQISFQKKLAERNVYLHLDEMDILRDIKNLGIKS